MDDDDDEVPSCPLCLEELDATDRAVKACQCGYQVCLWCLHHIREQLSARCPACRTPYEEHNFKFAEVNPEQAAKEAKERATAKKERERREKLEEIERERARAAVVSQQKAKNNLKHVRILQRNLVYVIGLSLTLAREEVIRRADMFGKYGRMLRILVNRAHPFNADAPGGPSISAYVQYYRDSDASAAVRAMNNTVFDGREIRCAIATTKYCDVFVRSASAADPNTAAAHHCGNPQCMYYHSISPPDIVLTKEEVLARHLGPPPPAHLFLMDPRRGHMQPLQFQRPGIPHSSATLPIASAPNTTVSGTASVAPASRAISTRASAVPGSAVPMGSVPMGNSSQPIPTGVAAVPSSDAIPPNGAAIHINAAGGQPPMASSPRVHSGTAPGAGRKPGSQPRSASPAASPHGTPPSSPGPRRSAPRLGMSPVRMEAPPVSSMAPASLSSGTPGASTATSAPFMSSSVSNPQLPSTAGWASNNQGRSSSRSPSRRGPSASMDDPSRARPRIQIRRREAKAPPGFQDSSSTNGPPVPSRPPGFDGPGGSPANRAHGRSEVVKSTTMPPISAAPPPGFGPGPAAAKDPPGEEVSPTDNAAAWSQEASADEVFSTSERRARRPVGVPSQPVTQEVNGGMHSRADSRSELAQVLAKIGGDLGVSSEFQDIKNGPNTGGLGATADGSAPQPGLGSLFTDASYQGGYGSQPASNSSQRDKRVPQTQQSPAYGSIAASAPSAFARVGAVSLRAEVLQSRRNTSRFTFARDDQNERVQPAAASIPVPRPSVAQMAAQTSPRVSKPDGLPSSTGMQTESHVISEMTRSNASVSSTKQPSVPQPQRQSRSRFGFVDQEPSRSRPQQLDGNGTDASIPPNVAPDADPAGNHFDPSFANLSTAEKLASIFSSAQWSAERLPPMPTYEQQVDEVTGQRPEQAEDPNGVSGTATGPPVLPSSSAMSVAGSSDDRARPAEQMQSPNPQFAPPGFREATPGSSPETTAADNSSATSGVAVTSVTSGGLVSGGAEAATSGQTEESQSSGTESLEEDKRKSRAQRKRDKKARQLREAAERKAIESEVAKPEPVVADSTEAVSTGKDQPLPAISTGHSVVKNSSLSPVLPSVKDISKHLKPMRAHDLSKHLKPMRAHDDTGRFMSVSELEREVEAARAREAQLQDRLVELQRRIRSYDNVQT